MTEAKEMIENELSELGFTAAAAKVNTDRALARKLRIAFEHFRVVEPDKIQRFQQELRDRTIKDEGKNQWGTIQRYDSLKFTPIEKYPNVPPIEALQELRKAKAFECFDRFEVATIESVKIVPDPIIFGVIDGSLNKYYICQWDDDVKIEDILREDEG